MCKRYGRQEDQTIVRRTIYDETLSILNSNKANNRQLVVIAFSPPDFFSAANYVNDMSKARECSQTYSDT